MSLTENKGDRNSVENKASYVQEFGKSALTAR